MPSFPRFTRVLCCAAVAQGLGCATVTQDDPPSHLTGSSGGQTAVPAGSSGAGGTAPIADMAAPGGRTMPQPGVTQNNGGAGSPPIAGTGGSAGTGGAPRDAGPQFATGTVLLEENFENFSATTVNWVASAGSVWTVGPDAELVSNVYTQTENSNSAARLAVAGDTAWRDVVLEADMKVLSFNGSSTTYMAGLCVRVSDAQNFYLVGLRGSSDGKLGLRRFTGGGSNLVESELKAGTAGVWYHLRVDAIGDTISAYLDGELMFSQTDTTHANGGIALCTAHASASFDNVRVTAP